MRILLDNIIFSLQQSGGISVYWGELIKGLQRSGLPVSYIERGSAGTNIQRQALSLPQADIQREVVLPLRLARYLPVSVPGAAGSIFHSSYYRPIIISSATTVVTVYDFIYEKHLYGLKRSVHRWQKQMALQRAARIICLSENTRRDLLEFHPYLIPERIRVIPLAASEAFRPVPDMPTSGNQTVLFVGGRSRYKNFSVAVETVAHMPGKHLGIIGGGALSLEERRLLETKLPGRYRHSPAVRTAELNAMYNTAYCLLYPSGYEGFGIPPLEAMQAGCPVVAVRGSSLPEICGDAALLADRPEPEQFCALLGQLESTENRMRLQERGFRQAARFSWERTCRETIACYRDAAQSAGQL